MRQVYSYLLCTLVVLMTGAGSFKALGQTDTVNIFDPNDPVVVYDPANPPEQPEYGRVGKWVKTNRLSWNTSSYKCYIYKGVPFRLRYPKNYDPSKSYPIYLFFHGRGEYGKTIYDNEYQLAWGAQLHMNAVEANKMNAFLLYPQNQAGPWYSSQTNAMQELIEQVLVPQLNVDPFRVYLDGLSAGGSAAWGFLFKHLKTVAVFTPISAASVSFVDSIKKHNARFTPIWLFQGGLDKNPTPGISRYINTSVLAMGGNFTYTEFPTRGHDCWNAAWQLPDYYPFLNKAYKSNPWPLQGRTEFCPGEPVVDSMGVTPGFDGYEWSKDGVVIPGANSHIYVATDFGTYACRIKKGTRWSEWSPSPVVIKLKSATISPNIEVSGLFSNVLPAPDGSTSVTLQVPDKYVAYEWQKEGSATVLGTLNTLTVSAPGQYKIKVTEKFGCSSNFSNLFPVINAAGKNGPAPVAGVIASATSKTSIQLNWSQNSSPIYNETGFEIYQSTGNAGPYKLVAIAPADISEFPITDLTPGTTYSYKIRPVNGNAAAATSEAVEVVTLSDTTAPTAPSNLRVTNINRNSIELLWDQPSDDVSVEKYDVYVNGVKSFVTESTGYTVYNLKQNTTYTFLIRARDGAGNQSPASNQASATTIFTGLSYKYYEGAWNVLPNFSNLTPKKTGFSRNVDLAPRQVADNFGFLWEGFIKIPVGGSYTFRTNSDDGSRLWLNTYNFNTASLVNNDGNHGQQNADGTITLNAGVYPISIGYIERTGGESMTLYWNNPQTMGTFVRIPDSAFTEIAVTNGQPPVAPSNLTATPASYSKINLSWTDNSNDETAFELLRSTDRFSGFAAIARTAPNSNTYTDSALTPNTTYYYRVRAINGYGESEYDIAKGNGVDYAYYENNGNAYATLPNYNNLVPVKVGRLPNFTLGSQLRSANYGFKYEGMINIPAAGTYTFFTTSDPGSKLYIGGYSEANLVVNNDGIHGAVEKSGSKTFAAPGLYPITVVYFNTNRTASLSARISGPGLAKQIIPVSMLGTTFVNATTLSLPEAPLAPDALVATATSSSTIEVSWTDHANNEEKYDVYRSAVDNLGYVKIASLPADTQSFLDTALFGNSVFYYKVRAVGVGGSVFSNEDSAKTTNDAPVLAPIADYTMRFGTQLQIPVVATDNNAESLSIAFGSSLPAFATFTPGDNGQGVLTFSPQESDMASYPVEVTVIDQNGGTTALTFNLVVNDNYRPAVNPVTAVTVNEKKTAQLALSATDPDAGDALTWSFNGLPSFATVNGTGNAVQLDLAPGYADAKVYPVTAYVNDGRGGVDSTAFTITVNDVVINRKFYININNTANLTGYWNNIGASPALGLTRTGFKDSTGAASTVGFKVLTDWAPNGTGFNSGAVTGNNTGAFVDNAMLTGWYINNVKQTIQLTGLDPSLKYKLTFFGSKGSVNADRSTSYTVNGTTVILQAANNTQNTVSVKGLTPNADSTISFDIKNAMASPYAYLNVLVIESGYDDGTVPVVPVDLNAEFTQAKVKLTWKDPAYNENAYQIFRSTSLEGTYALIATVGNNTVSYLDSNSINANTTYFYKIKGVNDYGDAGFSNTAQVAVGNLPPVLQAISNVRIKSDETQQLAISATDTPGEALTITGSNLPAFAALTDNGNGTAVLSLNPAVAHVGVYQNVKVTVADNQGVQVSRTFSITVTNNAVNSIFVNFNPSLPNSSPWNNFTGAPTVGKVLANVKDEFGANSGINVTLTDAWQGSNTAGLSTGNNSGVFPDTVMMTYYYESTVATKRITLSGLSASKKYNLSFLSNWNKTGSILTNFTVGGQTIKLNAANNTTNLAKFNGLSPDGNGQIQIVVAKDATSSAAILNAMAIEVYDASYVVAPSKVIANSTSKSEIALSWTDNSEETGFEIWRATSENGSYAQVGTTASNGTTFTDNGLSENTTYFYKVRAANGGSLSAFSVPASATTRIGDFNSVYVNFNQTLPYRAPWNSFTTSPTAGKAITNILDEKGINTGITVTLRDAWQGPGTAGVVTGNNSGLYPDTVMQTYYYESSTATKRILLSGLSAGKKYNLSFFSSWNKAGSIITNFTAGGQTKGLNAAGNTSKLAKFNGLTADVNGQIEVGVARDASSGYAILNAMVIEIYDPGTLLAPTKLGALGVSKSKVNLNWVDNSEETGFQIWRSTAANGVYSLVTTTGANVTTYSDQGLTENTAYYYKVMAVSGGQTSSFSNVAKANTLSYVVNVNFNFETPAAAPWNNTNSLPELYAAYPNLSNDQGNPSGLDMTVVGEFSGVNPAGMTTGNNSGVVPDLVMTTSWYTGPGVTGQLKIDGLSQVNEYNFVFFGSRNGTGDRTTLYQIGNQVVSLNAAMNTSNTVQINNVKPDANGSVVISVTLGPTSTFGYLNALIIQGFNPNGDAAQSGTGTLVASNSPAGSQQMQSARTIRTEDRRSESAVAAYPNPFRDAVRLSVELTSDVPALTVKVTDISGRVISLQQFRDLQKGTWQQQIQLKGKELPDGVYLVHVTGLPGEGTRVMKLVKRK